jgi:predicted nucleic acid-binding protein
VLNVQDKHHAACVELFDGFDGTLVVPSLVITEVCYLAQAQVGPHAEARFLDSIVAGELVVEHPGEQDWARITQLVRQYAGFPLGVADASVIAIAERLSVTRLASIDHRHMRAVRPAHCDAFELLPG